MRVTVGNPSSILVSPMDAGTFLGVIGIALGIVGLGVTFAVIEASRGEFWIARVCFGLSAFILAGSSLYWSLSTEMSLPYRTVVGCVIGLLVFVAFPESIRWVNSKETKLAAGKHEAPPLPSKPKPSVILPPKIHDLFLKDFTLGSTGCEATLTSQDKTKSVKIEVKVYQDFESNSKFMGFYIPRSGESGVLTKDVCGAIPHLYKAWLDQLSSDLETQSSMPGETMKSSKDLLFTGQMYIYYEDEMSLEELGSLDALYKSNGLSVIFRGQNYATIQWFQAQLKKDK